MVVIQVIDSREKNLLLLSFWVFVCLAVQRYFYLTFKKGDRLDARNWLMISLRNVDLKIDARAIAGWLLKVIHFVVAKDQTCGVSGCSIGKNVAFLQDVSYATTFDFPVDILSLDQEKAFDRVDWGFMLSTLLIMGYGASFVNWVRLFYTNVQSAVNVDGYLSSFFSLSCGVHQGCYLRRFPNLRLVRKRLGFKAQHV